jgi:signal transduction histidine kinase
MMQERADAVGAQLVVTSQPGHGTEVRLYWPKTAGMESL